MTDYNYREVNMALNRIDLCDLLLACTAAEERANDGGKKWARLHEKIKNILDDFDRENMEDIA